MGAVGGTITAKSVHTWYATLNAPPGTPPNWVFAPAWTLLYVMIGVAGWMVWQRNGASRPLRLWGWQLAANALWVPAFFGLHSPPLGMAVIALMIAMTAWTVRAFRRVRRTASWLMLPYLGWSVFAGYLNAGFWLLNPT